MYWEAHTWPEESVLLWARKTTSQSHLLTESQTLSSLLHLRHRKSWTLSHELRFIECICLLQSKQQTSVNDYLGQRRHKDDTARLTESINNNNRRKNRNSVILESHIRLFAYERKSVLFYLSVNVSVFFESVYEWIDVNILKKWRHSDENVSRWTCQDICHWRFIWEVDRRLFII